MKAFDKNHFAVNEQSARGFVSYLSSKGELDPMNMTEHKLAEYFMAYQQEMMADPKKLSAAYRTRLGEIQELGKNATVDKPFTLDMIQTREPISLIAIAEMMEYAVTIQDRDAYLLYGKVLGMLSKEGANIYRAINLSLRHKDMFHVDTEFMEDLALKDEFKDMAEELGFISVDCLGHALEGSPCEPLFEKIVDNYRELLAGRKEITALRTRRDAKGKHLEKAENTRHRMDELQSEIRSQQLALRASLAQDGLQDELETKRAAVKTLIKEKGLDARTVKSIADEREQLARTPEGEKMLEETAKKLGLTTSEFAMFQFATDELQIVCNDIMQEFVEDLDEHNDHILDHASEDTQTLTHS